MAGRILDHDPKVAKRWPYRTLNFLPSRQLWRYLTWKSGGKGPETQFEIGKALQETRRILIALPESLEELLIALPVVQAHFQSLPEAAIWLLAGPRETPFLSSIFGSERLLTLQPEEFYIGEEHYKDLLSRVQGMRLDMVLNFRADTPPLLHALLRMSQAPLRIQLGQEPPRPFANVILAPANPVNHLGHFQMAARLWDAAGIPLAGKWSRIAPPEDVLARADALLHAAGLKPKSTVIFPWQDRPVMQQLRLFKEQGAAAKREGISLAVLHSDGGLFASAEPPLEVTAAWPCLRTDSPGTLLGLFALASGVVGLRGPLLLLAGMTDTDVTGYFGTEDAPYDTSALNSRLRVVPLETMGS